MCLGMGTFVEQPRQPSSQKKPHRLLRSSSLNLLSIPKTKTVTYGDRSFSVIAPKLWNDLLIIIKQCFTVDSFKLRLKTFLFSSVYS